MPDEMINRFIELDEEGKEDKEVVCEDIEQRIIEPTENKTNSTEIGSCGNCTWYHDRSGDSNTKVCYLDIHSMEKLATIRRGTVEIQITVPYCDAWRSNVREPERNWKCTDCGGCRLKLARDGSTPVGFICDRRTAMSSDVSENGRCNMFRRRGEVFQEPEAMPTATETVRNIRDIAAARTLPNRRSIRRGVEAIPRQEIPNDGVETFDVDSGPERPSERSVEPGPMPNIFDSIWEE